MQRVGRHDPGHPSSVRRDVLCVMAYSDGGAAGRSCGTTAALRAGRIGGLTSHGAAGPTKAGDGPFPVGGRMRFYQLVPDGVAHVEATLRDGSVRVLDVHDNAVELSLGSTAMLGNIRTRWLDALGEEVEKAR